MVSRGSIRSLPAGATTLTQGQDDAGCRTFSVSPLVFWDIVEAHKGVARVVMTALAHKVRAAEQALWETRVELAEARTQQG